MDCHLPEIKKKRESEISEKAEMFLSNKWKAGNKPNFSKINTHYKRNVTRSSITAHDGWITKAEYSKAVDGLTTSSVDGLIKVILIILVMRSLSYGLRKENILTQKSSFIICMILSHEINGFLWRGKDNFNVRSIHRETNY